MERFGAKDQHRVARYIGVVEGIESGSEVNWSGPLVSTNDSDHLVFPPEGCAIEQLAVQRKDSLFLNRRFTIRKDHFDRMSVEHKAGLLVREAHYFDVDILGNTFMSNPDNQLLSPKATRLSCAGVKIIKTATLQE